jgi:hypothetical protein
MENEKHPYEDILYLPYNKSTDRPQMSLHDRAAQFSAFAALSGFDGVIAETGRLTCRRAELSEGEKQRIDRKLARMDAAIRGGSPPSVTVVFFVPDPSKEGGTYREYSGKVKHIDPVERKLVFFAANGRSDGKRIRIDDIAELYGETADGMDSEL